MLSEKQTKATKVPIKPICSLFKNNLDACLNKYDNKKCKYLKRILDICQKRGTKIYRMGP
jgi:hypothetical protein